MYPVNDQTFTIPSPECDSHYRLTNISFQIVGDSKGIVTATVIAPPEESVWVRCWVSNAVEGGLAEAEVEATNDSNVEMALELSTPSIPELANIRIESSRHQTENVYGIRLVKGEVYFHEQLKLQLDSHESVLNMIENLPPEYRTEISPVWLEAVQNAKESEAWLHGFTAFDRESSHRIGQGGFKGRPNDGQVEIAYAVDEEFRGKGYATMIAGALTRYAFGNEIQKVIGETKDDNPASIRVLEKLGFENLGVFQHPEDGEVVRFQKLRESC